MSARQLSLYGKALLINTLILAKTTFLSNVLPIPETIIEKVHKNIFHYLWQNNVPEPIARKTLFLAKKKRDLNLKEPEAHNLPMQIKYLLSLKQKEKQPPWMHIATYWLGRHNYNKDFQHLKGNSSVKSSNIAPFYDRNLI